MRERERERERERAREREREREREGRTTYRQTDEWRMDRCSPRWTERRGCGWEERGWWKDILNFSKMSSVNWVAIWLPPPPLQIGDLINRHWRSLYRFFLWARDIPLSFCECYYEANIFLWDLVFTVLHSLHHVLSRLLLLRGLLIYLYFLFFRCSFAVLLKIYIVSLFFFLCVLSGIFESF